MMSFFDVGLRHHLQALHRECFLRGVYGSVGHQLGRCSCHGGPGLEDGPEDMTMREAARAAVKLFERLRGRTSN